MSSNWRQAEQLTVPGSGNATFTLAPGRPLALHKLTLWATTGARVLAGNLTFQPRINGKNLGSSTVIASTNTVNDVVLAGDDNVLPAGASGVDPFTLDVLITNAAASDVIVTVYAAGLGGSI